MISIIRDELRRISQEPVSADELKNAKDYIIGSLPLSLTSTDKISTILLSLQLNDRSINYLDEFSTKINKVTVEDIQRVAADLLDAEKLTTILVGKPENIENIIKIDELQNVE